MRHVTAEMEDMTCDTGQVTYDTQGVVNIVSKYQIPRANGLGVMML